MLERARLPPRALPRRKIAARDVLRRRRRIELHLWLPGVTPVPLAQRTLFASTWFEPGGLFAFLLEALLLLVALLGLLGGKRTVRFLTLVAVRAAVPAECVARELGLLLFSRGSILLLGLIRCTTRDRRCCGSAPSSAS